MYHRPTSSEDLVLTKWHRAGPDGLLVRFFPGKMSNGMPFFCTIRGHVLKQHFHCGPFGNFHLPNTTLEDARFTFCLGASNNAAYALNFEETLEALKDVRCRIDRGPVQDTLLPRSGARGSILSFEQPVVVNIDIFSLLRHRLTK